LNTRANNCLFLANWRRKIRRCVHQTGEHMEFQ
jgi:hypothetical protein